MSDSVSQSQPIRTRFMVINVEITPIPEQEDIHGAIESTTVKIVQLLDAIATRCQLIVMSTSFTVIPFVDQKVPEVAASLHCTVVYANGNPDTRVISRNIEGVDKRRFEKFVTDIDENVIIVEITFKYA